MDAQLAIEPVKQIQAIQDRAREGLQAYASGEDSEELLTTLIALIGGIFVETNDPDLTEPEKVQAFAELMGDVVSDRNRNKLVYFERLIDPNSPSPYAPPNFEHNRFNTSDADYYAGQWGKY